MTEFCTPTLEIGYFLVPSERGKGYGTEGLEIVVDYLFLSKDIMRIQAKTDQRNAACQKILEKAGFKKEGILRKNFLFERRMDRRLHLQHHQRRVERTKDSDKGIY